MASYDGTNKSSAGCAQHLPYWEIKTEHTKNLYNEAMAMASPEALLSATLTTIRDLISRSMPAL